MKRSNPLASRAVSLRERAGARRWPAGLAVTAVVITLLAADADAQPRGAVSPRDDAPIDLTGTWVSIVNEDWRWRMLTPPKGDYASVPLSARGREVADTWEPTMDGSCKAYGAAGLMRMPMRIRIGWSGRDALEIETDAGRQTRSLVFGATDSPPTPSGPPSLQGDSIAEWIRPQSDAGDGGPGTTPFVGDASVGTLKVVTRNLVPGWLRRNGVPYSDQTTITEYFSRFASPDGAQWFVVTTIVEDPLYLNGPFITSSHFRRESNNSGWSPTTCRSDN